MLFGVNHPEVEVRRGWATGNTFLASLGTGIAYRQVLKPNVPVCSNFSKFALC